MTIVIREQEGSVPVGVPVSPGTQISFTNRPSHRGTGTVESYVSFVNTAGHVVTVEAFQIVSILP